MTTFCTNPTDVVFLNVPLKTSKAKTTISWTMKVLLIFVFAGLCTLAKGQTFPAVPTSNATDTREHIEKRRKVKLFSYQRPGKKVRKPEELTQREGKALRKANRKSNSHSSARVFKKHNHHARAASRQRQKTIKRQMTLGTKFD